MVFIEDDLAGLLAPNRRARQASERHSLQFGQGVVRSWDTATGDNTVEYRGAILTNLPILNTGEAVALRRNSVVGILSQGGQYFILGRITKPGDPEFASASLEFAVAPSGSATNFAIGTTMTTKLTKKIAVPPWADEALILAGALGNVHNTSGGLDLFFIQIGISWSGGTDNGAVGTAWCADGDIRNIASWESTVISNPGSEITLDAKFQAQTAVAASAQNTAAIEASVVFRSVI